MIIGIDFEATGKEAREARITEIGAVLFDGFWEPVHEFSIIVHAPDYPPLSQEVVDVTGITEELLKREGVPPADALAKLGEFIGTTDKLVAYNMEYDGTLYACERRRLNVAGIPELPRERWLCAYEGVPWAEKYRCRKLSHLALDHGIMVDPSKLHRAVGDVKLMGALLRHAGHTVESMIAYAAIPWKVLRADIPPPWKDGGAGNAAAKERGYRYDSQIRAWTKKVKADQVEKEIAEAGFPVLLQSQ